MPASLANILKNSDKSKVPAGYTDLGYESVLDYFKSAPTASNNFVTGYNGSAIAAANNAALEAALASYRATEIGEITINSAETAIGGFYQQSKHIVCQAFPYLSVPIEKEGKLATGYTETIEPQYSGAATGSGYNSVPKFFNQTSLQGLVASLGGGDFKLGAALDVTGTLGMNYCNTLYPQQLTTDDLSKLVGAGLLYAEVILPYTDTNAKVVILKVATDATSTMPSLAQQGNLTVWNIYLPTPVLCCGSYANHFGFMVEDGSGKTIGEDWKFTFADGHYDHVSGTISGFSPAAVVQKVGDSTPASYRLAVSKFPAVKGGVVKDFCRVRLCVESAETAKGLLNKDVPESFVGFTEGALNVVTGAVTGGDSGIIGSADISDGLVYIPKDKLPPVMTPAKYERALRVMVTYENSSTNWVPKKITIDNGGVSWGSFQTSQKDGGLQACVQLYLNSNPQDSANSAVLRRWLPSVHTGSSHVSDFTRDSEFVKALIGAAEGIDRNLCIRVQSELWARAEELLPGKGISYFNAAKSLWTACGFTSPLAFLFCMYTVNAGYKKAPLVSAAKGQTTELGKL